MAFPTAAQYYVKAQDNIVGQQPLMDTSTTQLHALGTIARGVDTGTLGYGACTCIYLKGVASTAPGDLVVYDNRSGSTVRTVAASRGNVAIALSANVANQYGWYVVIGQVPLSATGAVIANSTLAVTATDGQVTLSTASGQKIDGITSKTALNTPTTGFIQAGLAWAGMNGNT